MDILKIYFIYEFLPYLLLLVFFFEEREETMQDKSH